MTAESQDTATGRHHLSRPDRPQAIRCNQGDGIDSMEGQASYLRSGYCESTSMFMVYSKKIRDFPGGPVVKSPPANAEDSGSIPGRGAKIPHAWQPKDQNIKRSNIVANSIRNSKNDPHQKNHLISATDGILESCLKAVFTLGEP